VAINIHNAFLLIDYRAKSTTTTVEVLINNGDNGLTISTNSHEAGVVKTGSIFFIACALSEKRATGISPGIRTI
jgi:hypothetical protein